MGLKNLRQGCAGVLLICSLAACGGDASDEPAAAASGGHHQRGGTITVGEQVFTFVPSIQCSVYPGNVVSIAGHATEDESAEITIDYTPDGDGPTGVTIGTDSRPGSWFSIGETLHFEIDGRHVRGTTTFSEYRGGNGRNEKGSFDISC
jgi:hypothetical protein